MDMEGKSIKDSFLEKWDKNTLDDRLTQFSDNFEEWFSQIPEDSKSIIATLICKINYYPHQTVNKALSDMHNKLITLDTENINEDNTIFTFIKSKDGKSNSSNDYWTEYKWINRINNNLCFENINAITSEQWSYIKNIVFIDDFCGTGKSLKDGIENYRHSFVNKTVIVITVDILKKAIENLKHFADSIGFKIIVLSLYTSYSAFENDYFKDNEYAKEKTISMSHEFNIPETWIQGFQNSQALVVFYNNTPNNTLGFIWKDTNQYKSIFPRRSDNMPSWQKLQKDRKKRGYAKYNNAVQNNKG